MNPACYPTQVGCSTDVPSYDYNIERAKELMIEAGYPDGFDLEMHYYRDTNLAEVMANDLGPFFDFLLSEFDLDPDLLIKAANNYKTARSPENLRTLMVASEARRQDLFRRINQARNGTAMLVDLRGRLLGRLPENPDWKRIDLDLRHLLSSWFNRGFLRVTRIDWHSPAIILGKIMRYETVHKMHGGTIYVADWPMTEGAMLFSIPHYRTSR